MEIEKLLPTNLVKYLGGGHVAFNCEGIYNISFSVYILYLNGIRVWDYPASESYMFEDYFTVLSASTRYPIHWEMDAILSYSGKEDNPLYIRRRMTCD